MTSGSTLPTISLMKRPWYDWHKIQPWLEAKLKKLNISQTALARRIGISETLLSLAKNGRRSISPAKTHQLIQALGYNPLSVLRSLGVKPHNGPLLDNRSFTILMSQLESDGLIVLNKPRIKKLRAKVRKVEKSTRNQRYLIEKILRATFENRLLAALGRNPKIS